jgi:hypothetical protein
MTPIPVDTDTPEELAELLAAETRAARPPLKAASND